MDLSHSHHHTNIHPRISPSTPIVEHTDHPMSPVVDIPPTPLKPKPSAEEATTRKSSLVSFQEEITEIQPENEKIDESKVQKIVDEIRGLSTNEQVNLIKIMLSENKELLSIFVSDRQNQ
eukprot:NODE_8814_length_644_cov_13.975048_g8189_i0.p1 GENE.NODE_8814_length_644_cov_13.975048_g8189_i0~~NODE_8814_length_644_cov_13.975048_g8189_i0.p1  ORF type:complete len:120 (-),score=23.86 NODE_8814_length_644_cov_13.975048_g8189_i0:201-560(-)